MRIDKSKGLRALPDISGTTGGLHALAIAVVAAAVTGCAAIPRDAGFKDVQDTVANRTGQRIAWSPGGPEDAAVTKAIDELLAKELNAGEAVQIALLNNRGLRATFEDLNLAQANLVQAGLLNNLLFTTAVGVPLDGGSLDLSFGIVQDFLSILYRPLRRQIATSQFAATKLRVAEGVIDLAARVQEAFYETQADQQRIEFLQQVVTATAASAETARRLREAGNITDLDLAREQALYEEARLALATAQTRLIQNRERLSALMGLWGDDTRWTVASRLPDLPNASKKSLLKTADLEQRAIEANFALGATRREIEAAAGVLGFMDATALIPFLQPGIDAEREEGEWEVGPSFAFPLPIFNQGRARVAAAQSDLRRAQQLYWAQAIEIRALVRTAHATAISARNRARHVQTVLLPLYTRAVNNTQLQYNAMQVGVFSLLQAKQQQVNAGLRYIETLLEYWLARTALEQILNGSLADVGTTSMAEIPAGSIPGISIQ
ncbi:MAG: TolC family protein [Pseudomonadota bacterium]|nr:TolC family protein [Pseudomonadota bacterium]